MNKFFEFFFNWGVISSQNKTATVSRCESCGLQVLCELRPYYAEAAFMPPSGEANVCLDCYRNLPSDQMSINILLNRGLELTDYLKEELNDE